MSYYEAGIVDREHIRNELRVVIGMERVDAFFAIAQEVLHSCLSIRGDSDSISGTPHLRPNEHHINVQLPIQLT